MIENGTTMIVARVDGFDPNRPDLQEFLDSLLAKALKGEARVRHKRLAKKTNAVAARSRPRTKVRQHVCRVAPAAAAPIEWTVDRIVAARSHLVGKNVKLVTVIDGQGETATASDEEIRLRTHIGEICKIVAIGEDAFQVVFDNGEKLWVVPEEISPD